MNRLVRLATLARAATSTSLTSSTSTIPEAQVLGWNAWKMFTAEFSASPAVKAATTDITKEDFGGVATGEEKEEMDALSKGMDPYHEAWLDAPFGTEDKPVEVTSEYSERIVGVPDPDDDSLVWWGVIEEGQGPKQIIEGGEYFVLKRLPSSGGHH